MALTAQMVFSELAEMACNTPAVLKDEYIFGERKSREKMSEGERVDIEEPEQGYSVRISTGCFVCMCMCISHEY